MVRRAPSSMASSVPLRAVRQKFLYAAFSDRSSSSSSPGVAASSLVTTRSAGALGMSDLIEVMVPAMASTPLSARSDRTGTEWGPTEALGNRSSRVVRNRIPSGVDSCVSRGIGRSATIGVVSRNCTEQSAAAASLRCRPTRSVTRLSSCSPSAESTHQPAVTPVSEPPTSSPHAAAPSRKALASEPEVPSAARVMRGRATPGGGFRTATS